MLSFRVKSSKWHLFLLRLLLNKLKPSPLLQVNTDFVFSPPQPWNTASRHFLQRRGKIITFSSFLKLYLTRTMIWIYTDEFVDYRVYKEASKKSAIRCKFAYFLHHTDMLLCALRRPQTFPRGSSLLSVYYKRRAANARIFFFVSLFCFLNP